MRPGRHKVTWIAPPEAAQVVAREALRRQEALPPSRRGGLTPAKAGQFGITSGRDRARSIAAGELQPAEDLWAFFARFQGTFDAASDKAWEQSKVQQAWDLWGGEPMREAVEKALGKTMENPKIRSDATPIRSAPGWSMAMSPRKQGGTYVTLLQDGEYRGDGVWNGSSLQMRPGFAGSWSLVEEAQLQLAEPLSSYRNPGWAARKRPTGYLDSFRSREAAAEREHDYWLDLQNRVQQARTEPELAELAREAQQKRLASSTIRNLVQSAIAERARFLGFLRAPTSGAADARYLGRLTSGRPTQMNPVDSRIDYVAKNFNDIVTTLVALAWLGAVGADEEETMLRRTLSDPRFSGTSSAEVAQHVSQRVSSGRIPANSRFDRYLPWLASAISREMKPALRAMAKAAKAASLPKPTWDNIYRPPLYESDSPFYPLRARNAAFRQLLLSQDTIWSAVLRFRSIVDWAEAENVDISKISLEDAMDAAAEWGERRKESKLVPGNVIYRWPDGWTVQHLTTQEQLDGEGTAMQHCVAEYYDPEDEDIHIYSIRDADGRPHVTIEWRDDEKYVAQVKGKQNAEPKWEYLKRAIEFRAQELDRRAGTPMLEPVEPPDHADGIKSKFLGAFDMPFLGGREIILVYEDGSWITVEVFEDYVNGVRQECIESMGENFRDDEVAIDQCLIDTLNGVKPTEIAELHYGMRADELEESQHWSLWKQTGAAIDRSSDEMVEFLANKDRQQIREAQAALGRPKSAANPRRSALSRRNELKRKLMR